MHTKGQRIVAHKLGCFGRLRCILCFNFARLFRCVHMELDTYRAGVILRLYGQSVFASLILAVLGLPFIELCSSQCQVTGTVLVGNGITVTGLIIAQITHIFFCAIRSSHLYRALVVQIFQKITGIVGIAAGEYDIIRTGGQVILYQCQISGFLNLCHLKGQADILERIRLDDKAVFAQLELVCADGDGVLCGIDGVIVLAECRIGGIQLQFAVCAQVAEEICGLFAGNEQCSGFALVDLADAIKAGFGVRLRYQRNIRCGKAGGVLEVRGFAEQIILQNLLHVVRTVRVGALGLLDEIGIGEVLALGLGGVDCIVIVLHVVDGFSAFTVNGIMGHLSPAVNDGSCIIVAGAQFGHDLCVDEQIGIKHQICVHGVAAALGTGGRGGTAAGGSRAGDGIQFDRRRLRSRIANGELLGHGLEAVGVYGQGVFAVLGEQGLVIVIQRKGAADEVPVVDLGQFAGVAVRVGQVYAIDRHSDAVNHVFYVKVYAGRIRRYLFGGLEHLRASFVHHMDGEQTGYAVGGHAQLITAVGEEIGLAKRDIDAGNGVIAVRMLLIDVVGQLVVQGGVGLVGLHQRNVRNAIYPCLFGIGAFFVVEHQLNIAADLVIVVRIIILIQYSIRRVVRDRALLGGAERGLGRRYARAAAAVVVGDLVIPNVDRAVRKEVIRCGLGGCKNRSGRVCVVRQGNSLTAGAVGYDCLGRIERGDLPLDNIAVIGNRRAGRGNVHAVYEHLAVCERVAVGETDGNILAPAEIDQLGLACDNEILLGRAAVRAARGRAAARGTARGRTAAGRAARGGIGNGFGLAGGNVPAAGLNAGGALCGCYLGAAYGYGNVVRVGLYALDLACAGDLRALGVGRDGADRSAALHRDGGGLADRDGIDRARNGHIGVGEDALAGLGVRERYAALAAAQHDAAGNGNIRQVGCRHAVRDDEITIDGLSGQRNAVFTHDHTAVDGVGQGITRIGVGIGHFADDLGKFCAGDAAFRVQLAVRAVYIAVLDQSRYRALRPCGNGCAVTVTVQHRSIAAVERECARQHGESLLAGDGLFRAQQAVRAHERVHGDCLAHVICIPCVGENVGVAGHIRGLVRAECAVDDGRHLCAAQQAIAVDEAVRAVQQAVVNGAAHTGRRPVGRKIGKIVRRSRECIRWQEHGSGQKHC